MQKSWKGRCMERTRTVCPLEKARDACTHVLVKREPQSTLSNAIWRHRIWRRKVIHYLSPWGHITAVKQMFCHVKQRALIRDRALTCHWQMWVVWECAERRGRYASSLVQRHIHEMSPWRQGQITDWAIGASLPWVASVHKYLGASVHIHFRRTNSPWV